MKTKICSKCLLLLPETDFYRKTPTNLRSDCKSCHKLTMRSRSKEHYNENKEYYRKRNERSRKELAQLIKQYKIKHNICTDCKLPHPPWRLEFDHIDPKLKTAEVSTLTSFSKEKILKEISKCQIVCANCHRDRTYYRRMQSASSTTRTRNHEGHYSSDSTIEL
jgi:hypothetical protein